MIPEVEIREFARKNGVPETTVERDYAQNWLLSSLPHIMALKGGTGIRKVYIGNYRFSDDLDFTLLEDVEADELKDFIVKAVREAKKRSGIDFDENIRFRGVDNGYDVTVYFRILRRAGNPLRIKIDITKRENEATLLPLERRKIIHPYSDKCETEVLTYSLQEIFAEKIRSLFQRTRPRDLYDVWLLSKLGLDVSGIIDEKFRFKGVKADFDGLLRRKEDFRNAWESSLRHQLRDLPDFNVVFDDVMEFLGGVL
ncbi:nucleotidyl transferase AbiEii/AbiGii toxin family protein [Archaeoglobus neptunius]|uniref:nucleotidyl transferase AbiEii/AbiGii toxin family protein n=1 Tax=Archaeoglobus neptunius TaxID=2798580 RepID=UPI001928B329|nr:nucleotidyl transferase AbiEii/AbiGii toxin family protein [Archaeoglobus neptunius]